MILRNFSRNLIFAPSLILAIYASPALYADFQIQEASIESIQGVIRPGEVTCKDVVKSYFDAHKINC